MPVLLEYYKPGLSARRRAGICLFLCCISAFCEGRLNTGWKTQPFQCALPGCDSSSRAA